MDKKSPLSNPYLIFSPFFLFYCFYIIRYKWPSLYGDEPRYINFASNLLHGFYSPPAPHINLWNGPGYPIVLMLPVALHLPIIFYPLLNALFYYLSIVFLYKSINLFLNNRLSLLLGLIWAFYFNIYPYLPAVLTEVFTAFLISSFIYSLTLLFKTSKNRYLIISGLLLGFLALTKVLFGYVILVCLLACIISWFLKRNKSNYLKSTYILAIAFILTIPYLAYTYHLTLKLLYWGNAGGMSLYWMSSPHELEYGDWKVPDLTNSLSPMPFKTTEGDSLLKANHQKEINFIMKHQGVEQDELFKKVAIKNIKQHPKKFIRNYFYNLSRMLFDFPYSYNYQITQTISNILMGSFILWTSVIATLLTVINWNKMIYPIKFCLLIITVYIALSGLLSAYARQLDVVVPVLLFWIALALGKLPKPTIRIA